MTRQHPIEMIYPPNTLKAKVGGSLKSMSQDAIARAEEALAGLRDQMKEWVEEEVRNLKTAHTAFRADPTDKDARAGLYTRLHDLKGLGTTYELPLVTRVAGSACGLMLGVSEHNALPADLVSAHVDAIFAIARDNIKDPEDKLGSALAAELERQVAAHLTV